MEEAKENLAALGLAPEALTADRGHHSAENLVELEAAGVTPIIRQRAPAGTPGFRAHDFTYIAEADEYRCPAGNALPCRGVRHGKVRYQARASVCRRCEHFGVCTKSKQGRVIDRTMHQAELERNRERVRSAEGKELLGKHRQRAEGPWSYAKLYGGLARISPRGLANAIKRALLQGIGWNLMKLIARLTGLSPRGKSEMGKACAGSRRVIVSVCAYICHFSALIAHGGALMGLRLRLRRWHADQARDFSRKHPLSQGC